MRISNYVIGAPLEDPRFYILMHGLTGSVDKVLCDIGKFFVENRGKEINEAYLSSTHFSEATYRKLSSRGYITNLTYEEERTKMVEIATILHERDIFGSPTKFMFVPSYMCNLRCPYCYQPHSLHAGKGKFGVIMDEENVNAAFKVIDNFAEPGALAKAIHHKRKLNEELDIQKHAHKSTGNITLFGGEPLSTETLEIVPYIVEQSVKRGRTVSAITNGVELDKFVDFLGPGLIEELQITVDGLAELHDARRIGPKFRKTFDTIVSNVSMALSKKTRVALRMNIDKTNINDLQALSTYFDKLGWTSNDDFHAGAASVDFEGNSPYSLSKAELVNVTLQLADSWNSKIVSYENQARSTLSNCLDGNGYPFRRIANCTAETGLLIFDPLGDVYTCWDEVGQAPNRIATYDKKGIKFNEEIVSKWLSRFPGAIEECSVCPYALIHTSGCAMHARQMSGTMFSPACESFKDYFPQTFASAYQKIEDLILQNNSKPMTKLPVIN